MADSRSTTGEIGRAVARKFIPSPTEVAVGLAIGIFDAQIATQATTVYEHRGVTHKGLKFHPAAEAVAHFVLWAETTIDRIKWAGIHRGHHAKSDQPGDPHSPYILTVDEAGNLKVTESLLRRLQVRWNSIGEYRRFGRNHPGYIARLARDIPKGPGLYNNGWIPIVGLVARDLALTRGNFRIAAIALVRHPIYLRGQGAVNETGHSPDPKRQALTKNLGKVWALVTGGETLHGNHHDFQSSPRFGFRPGEWDTGWLIVRGLRRLGLVEVTKPGRKAMARQDETLAREMRDHTIDEIEEINSSNGQGRARLGRLNRYLVRRVVPRVRESSAFRGQIEADCQVWEEAFGRLRPRLRPLLDPDATSAIAGVTFGRSKPPVVERTPVSRG